ncbi:MAG: ABC transporter ATP-binding protein [Fibrobacter sp.]|nr:ABC transporter ATP-binding protein [Fibrobacter sp.]
MEEFMIQVENVSKQYRLGQIGGTTLRDELHRIGARLFRREDPTKKIGARSYEDGEIFNALNGVSFCVKKGERVGIIGHNGAGKSTLLKLISRITAPTDGAIGLNGRVASMLEVGTGFHPELTGRENIYMNGAILGMTKREINAKVERIIDFSECRQFIDTPVKRYSSGMFVKLAFSVAAHLDSEIVIMDEVLAVGDMAFQQKCIAKMNEISQNEHRTILYVSHNMNTIRELCSRCVVLSHGSVVYDGDVEPAIDIYMNSSEFNLATRINLAEKQRLQSFGMAPENVSVKMSSLELVGKETPLYGMGEDIPFDLELDSKVDSESLSLRLAVMAPGGQYVGDSFIYDFARMKPDEKRKFRFVANFGGLMPGRYAVSMLLFRTNKWNAADNVDGIKFAFYFEVRDTDERLKVKLNNVWNKVLFRDIKLIS